MKKWLFWIILSYASSCFGSAAYLDVESTTAAGTKSFTYRSPYLYAAKTYSGVCRHDVTDPMNIGAPTCVDCRDPDGSFDPNAIEASRMVNDGTYLYAVYRNGSPTYSAPTFLGDFEEGDADLTDGSTSWTGGTQSGGNTLIGDDAPFWGEYAAKLTISSASGYATAYKTITGGASQNHAVWMKIASWSGSSGSFTIPIFMVDGNEVLRMVVTYVSPSAFTVKLQARTDAGSYSDSAQSSNLSVGTWYNFMTTLSIASGAGSAALSYRTNFADEFTASVSLSSVDNDTLTPNRTAIGASAITTLSAAAVYFDEVAVQVGASLYTTMWNEGALIAYTLSPFAIVDQVNVEAKLSDVKVRGGYAYVSSQVRGFTIYNVSNPADIRYVSQFNTGSYETQGLDVDSDYAYIANYGYGLTIIDVSNVNSPSEVSRLDFSVSSQCLWNVLIDGDLLYGTVSTVSCAPGERGLVVYDVSDRSKPYILSFLPFSAAYESACASGDDPPYQLRKTGDYIYMSNGDLGVSVAHVGNPSDPYWAESFDVSVSGENIRGLEITDGILFMGEMTNSHDLYSFFAWPDGNAYLAQSATGRGSGVNDSNRMSIATLNAISAFSGSTMFHGWGRTLSAAFNPSGAGSSDAPLFLSDCHFTATASVDQQYWNIIFSVFDGISGDGVTCTAANTGFFNNVFYNTSGDGIELQQNAPVKNCIFSSIAGSDINENGGVADSANNWSSTYPTPVLTNPAGDDFSLGSGSPCLDAGSLGKETRFSSRKCTDFESNAILVAPYDKLNIGADQSESKTSLRGNNTGVIIR